MTRMRFTLNEPGLERLLSSGDADHALTAVAEDLAREWRRNDPRHRPPRIEVGNPGRDGGVGVVPVGTFDSIWHIIEFGSINNPPYRPATRAAHAAGLEFKDER